MTTILQARTLRVTLALAIAGAVQLAQAENVIKIGAPLALTGGLADEGKKQRIAYDMWLQRVNEAGGIDVAGTPHQVELVTYDYQTDGKRAAQLTEKLITGDEVHFLSAPFGSGHTKIAAGVAERYGIPIMASVASSVSVYDQGYKNLFGTLAPNTGLTDAMLSYFKEQFPEASTIAVLGREDVFPNAMAASLVEGAAAAGFEVVYDQRYAVGTLDHASALSQIKSLSPDWIYVTGYTQDLILARKQMADLGVSADIVTMITGPAYKEFIDSLGELAEGVSSTTWWHHSTAYESDDVFGSTKAFYDAFVEQQGSDPDYVHASSAAALVALQKAIEQAGSLEPDKVRQTLAELDIMTFYGPINFADNGMNQARELPIIQVQGGTPVVLFPPSVQQADAVPVK